MVVGGVLRQLEDDREGGPLRAGDDRLGVLELDHVERPEAAPVAAGLRDDVGHRAHAGRTSTAASRRATSSGSTSPATGRSTAAAPAATARRASSSHVDALGGPDLGQVHGDGRHDGVARPGGVAGHRTGSTACTARRTAPGHHQPVAAERGHHEGHGRRDEPGGQRRDVGHRRRAPAGEPLELLGVRRQDGGAARDGRGQRRTVEVEHRGHAGRRGERTDPGRHLGGDAGRQAARHRQRLRPLRPGAGEPVGDDGQQVA